MEASSERAVIRGRGTIVESAGAVSLSNAKAAAALAGRRAGSSSSICMTATCRGSGTPRTNSSGGVGACLLAILAILAGGA